MDAPTEQTGEDLLNAAQLGKKLKPSERLAVVVYLERSGEIEKWRDDTLARALGCSKGVIKKYRKKALALFASAISSDEAMTIMADYVRWNDILLKQAYKGLMTVAAGTGAHQTYIRILGELWDQKISKLQGVGVIPKELGRLTTIKEEWIASASPDGVVGVERVEDTPATKEGD